MAAALILPAGVVAGSGSVSASAAPAASHGPGPWVTSWGSSAMAVNSSTDVPSFDDQTVRNIVYTTVGGSQLRIRVSNAFGDRPLQIGAASVGRQLRKADLDPATVHPITFGGAAGTTVPVGGSVLSDPVTMDVPRLSTVAVSLYLPAATGPATYHRDARQTNYIAPGDAASDVEGKAYTQTVEHSYFVDALQVRGPARSAIVTLGDSITDGTNSQTNANARWPNFLARRLVAKFGQAAPAVVDEGIIGNRILSDSACLGVKTLDRLDRDVLDQPNVRAVIFYQGVNDLGFSQYPDEGCTSPNTEVSVPQLIAAYRTVIDRVHARGIKIYGGTITPAEGFNFWNDEAEVKRQQVNNWIRHSHAFDGVIDFDKVMAYPGHGNLMNPAYDSGDGLHPNDGGYAVMADSIDLDQITR